MDPLFLGAAAIAAGAVVVTAVSNWRLGRRADAAVQARARDLADDAAKRAGLELGADGHWRCQRDGRAVDVELVPLAETSHRLVVQRFRADVRVAPVRAVERATFRIASGDFLQVGDIQLGDADLDRALAIRGSDPADVKAILGDKDVVAFLRGQLVEFVDRYGPRLVSTRFGAIVVDDQGLCVDLAPAPTTADGRDPTKLEQVIAAVDFATTFADRIDAAHARAPRSLGAGADRQATSGGGTSAGVRAL